MDYRALNVLTTKDVFPLPLVDECLETLAGNVWYSKLDAKSEYWQLKIKPEDCSKTAFITKYGLFEFARMAFGLCNSPATYASHQPGAQGFELESGSGFPRRYPVPGKRFRGAPGQPWLGLGSMG